VPGGLLDLEVRADRICPPKNTRANDSVTIATFGAPARPGG
jgi:hypothetical protein